ncbi:MAG TPA: PTS sugar transporter subunit IIA [Candidatus Ozemobacteraceae bacterium]|nr:PTS sugar transporter subunit IIA [Candidatus Ozemobacteraceae bacterium]
MELTEFISPQLIKLELSSTQKVDAIKELIDLLDKAGFLTDADAFLKSVLEREKVGSTGIGKGIAIPHSRTATVREVVVAVGRSKEGIEFEALDSRPVHLIFLIAAPIESGGLYLKALARLSRLLRYQEFRNELMEAKTAEDIIKIISSEEK